MPFVAGILDAFPADALGWAGVVLVLGLYIGLIVLAARFRPTHRAAVAAAPLVLAPVVARDRDRAGDILEASTDPADAITALHAAATRQLDAIEYALDRLFEDCAALMSLPPRARDATAPVYVLAQPAAKPRSLAA